MFLHIGANQTLNSKKIISILKFNDSKKNKGTNIENMKKKIITLVEGNTKSYIITDDYIYISPVTVETLRKRIKEKKVY